MVIVTVVSDPRDLCWSESPCSQKHRREDIFRTEDQDQPGEVSGGPEGR